MKEWAWGIEQEEETCHASPLGLLARSTEAITHSIGEEEKQEKESERANIASQTIRGLVSLLLILFLLPILHLGFLLFFLGEILLLTLFRLI